jgi:hypothetical protein
MAPLAASRRARPALEPIHRRRCVDGQRADLVGARAAAVARAVVADQAAVREVDVVEAGGGADPDAVGVAGQRRNRRAAQAVRPAG